MHNETNIAGMLEKYINFTRILKTHFILEFQFQGHFPLKIYSRPTVARRQKSSQTNANCIRCVAIAGVCKRQNSSRRKFSARKTFRSGEHFGEVRCSNENASAEV